MVLVDSTVWIDHLRDQVSEKTEKLRSLLEDGDVVCTWVIIQEILQGAADPKKWNYCANTLSLCPKSLPASKHMSTQAPCIPFADGKGAPFVVHTIV
jgi:predicted nucleic acid-binding protein